MPDFIDTTLQPKRGHFLPGGTPRIDYTHPLARGLGGCWVATGEAGSTVIRDLVTGSTVGSPTAGSQIIAGPNGMMACDPSPTVGGWSGLAPNNAQPTPQISWMWFGRSLGLYAGGANINGMFNCRYDNAGGAPYSSWGYFRGAGTGTNGQLGLNITYATGGGFVSLDLPDIVEAAVSTLCVLTTLDLSAGVGNAVTYKNGRRFQTNAGLTTGALNYSATSTMWFGPDPHVDDTAAHVGTMLGCVWNRVLTDTEAEQLTTDPTCFLLFPSDILTGLAKSSSVVNMTITGASATTSANTVSNLAIAASVTGVAMTSAAGLLARSLSNTLTGGAGTTSAGVFALSNANTLVGTLATTTAHTLNPALVDTLTGALTTTAAGTVTISGTQVTLPGASATTTAGILVPGLQFSVVGGVATVTAHSPASNESDTLIGVVATTASGTLAGLTGLTLVGAVLTTAPGSLLEGLSNNLTGIVATSGAGTLLFTDVIGLTGTSAVSGVGAIVPMFVYSTQLTGAGATVSPGSMAEALVPLLTGTQALTTPGSFSSIMMNTMVGAASVVSPGIIINTPVPRLLGVAANASASFPTITSMFGIVGASAIVVAGLITRRNVSMLGAPAIVTAGHIVSGIGIVAPVVPNRESIFNGVARSAQAPSVLRSGTIGGGSRTTII